MSFSDSQLYFINLLVKRVLYGSESAQSYHPLSITLLAKQLGSKPRERYIQDLINRNLVEVHLNDQDTETYVPNSKSKSYRLAEELIAEVLRHELKTFRTSPKSLLAKRLMQLRTANFREAIKSEPKLIREFNWLKQLTFNKDMAYAFQEQFELTGRRGEKTYTRASSLRLEADINLLTQMHTGDISFSYNGIRLSTAVTGAMKQMRQCLEDRYGYSFVEVDLKSSQLTFLCKALVHYYCDTQVSPHVSDQLSSCSTKPVDLSKLDGKLPSDVIAFIRHVIHGDIYRELQFLESGYNVQWEQLTEDLSVKSYYSDSLKTYETSRDDFKQVVMKDILFNYYTRTKVIPDVAAAFEESYPSVTAFLKRLTTESQSKERSRDLALIVQGYEAQFFHFIALDLLETQFPDRAFYVVHDGIGIPEDISDEATLILNEAIGKYLGLSPNMQLIRV